MHAIVCLTGASTSSSAFLSKYSRHCISEAPHRPATIGLQAQRMRKPNRTTIAIAAILFGTWTLPLSAGAESKLTVLNGEWRGSGTDRNSPFESQQQTKCQSNNRADLVRMVSDTVCTGETGLHKVSHLTITLDADKIVGTFDETASFPGSNASPRILKGLISGVRAGDTATLEISFPGLIPSATVIFKFISSSSYSTQATSLGIPMMEVTYTRAAGR